MGCSHASQGVAPRNGADGGVVLLHLLPADVLQLGPAEVGVLFEDAQEVSRFNGNVLPDVADDVLLGRLALWLLANRVLRRTTSPN